MSVVHVQPSHAVAYVFPFSSAHASYQKDSRPLQQVLKTFTYMLIAVSPKADTEGLGRSTRVKRNILMRFWVVIGILALACSASGALSVDEPVKIS